MEEFENVFASLPSDWIEILKTSYPKRDGDQGWIKVRSLVPRRIIEGHSWDVILKGCRNYALHIRRKGDEGTEFVRRASSFFDQYALFAEYADMDMRPPAEIAQDAKWTALEARAKALGFTTVDRSHGFSVAETAVLEKEREAQQRAWRDRGLDQPKFWKTA